MGKYINIWITNDIEDFVSAIKDFPGWMRKLIRAEMEKHPEYLEDKIKRLGMEITIYQQKLDEVKPEDEEHIELITNWKKIHDLKDSPKEQKKALIKMLYNYMVEPPACNYIGDSRTHGEQYGKHIKTIEDCINNAKRMLLSLGLLDSDIKDIEKQAILERKTISDKKRIEIQP